MSNQEQSRTKVTARATIAVEVLPDVAALLRQVAARKGITIDELANAILASTIAAAEAGMSHYKS